MAALGDYVGERSISIYDDRNAGTNVDVLGGKVSFAGQLGRVAGTTDTGVEITLNELGPRGDVTGTVFRQEPPLVGVVHLTQETCCPRVLSGPVTVRSGDTGEPGILFVDFILEGVDPIPE